MDDIITGHAHIVETPDQHQQSSQQIHGNTKWPDWKADELKAYWAEGMTGGEIAKRLGMTRNAVVGKRWRMGLAPRQRQIHAKQSISTSQRRAIRAAKERQRRLDRNKSPAKKVMPAVPPGDIYMVDSKQIASIGVPLNKLRWNGTRPANCRAIISPDKAPVLYCGLPVWEGESYCAGHCRRFFNKFVVPEQNRHYK